MSSVANNSLMKNRPHYHITAVCISVSVPPVVMSDEIYAVFEYEKMVNVVQDLTGLDIMKYTEKSVTFTDGSVVRYYECDKDCFDSQKKHTV